MPPSRTAKVVAACAVAILTFGAGGALAQGRTYIYTYDSLGRVTTISRPDGSTTTYTYDASGNRTQTNSTAAIYSHTVVRWVVLPLGGMPVIRVYGQAGP